MMWFALAFGISLLCGPVLLRMASIPFTLMDCILTGLADWLQGGEFWWYFGLVAQVNKQLANIPPNDRRRGTTVVRTK
jgi:hypothetical protein